MQKTLFGISAFVFIFVMLLSSPSAGKSEIKWNDPQTTFFSSSASKSLKNFDSLVFPTETELKNAVTNADDGMRKDCIEWLKGVINDKWLPSDTAQNLIPLKAWVNGLDTFIVKYTLNDVSMQIAYNRSTVTVIIKVPASEVTKNSYLSKYWVMNVAQRFLLLPSPDDVRLARSKDCAGVSSGSWGIYSIFEDAVPETTPKMMSVDLAAEGSSVAFRMLQCYGLATPRPQHVIKRPLFDRSFYPRPNPNPMPPPLREEWPK